VLEPVLPRAPARLLAQPVTLPMSARALWIAAQAAEQAMSFLERGASRQVRSALAISEQPRALLEELERQPGLRWWGRTFVPKRRLAQSNSMRGWPRQNDAAAEGKELGSCRHASFDHLFAQ
jgi:hypothetical protein